MKKKIALLLCIGLFLLTGCGKIPTLKNGEQIVATINGKDFTAEMLYKELKGKAGAQILQEMIDTEIANKEIKDQTDAKDQAQNQLDYLKQQYADYQMDFEAALKENGYTGEKQLLEEFTANYLKQSVASKYIKESLTNKEIDDHYKNQIFGEMTVRHILIKPIAPDGKTVDELTDAELKEAEGKALEKAKGLINEINKGAKFEDVAKKNSDDEGTAENGGLFSNFVKSSVVENFWSASAKLKDGEMTKTPVKTEYGYHIILRISQNEKPKKDKVLETIKEELLQNKLSSDQNASAKAWVDIRKKYKLNIIDTDVEKQYNNLVQATLNAKAQQQ